MYVFEKKIYIILKLLTNLINSCFFLLIHFNNCHFFENIEIFCKLKSCTFDKQY